MRASALPVSASQRRSACPRGAAAMQRRRQRIEHGCSTENVTQAGVAQEHAVTDGQRQGSLQGEPHERAERLTASSEPMRRTLAGTAAEPTWRTT